MQCSIRGYYGVHLEESTKLSQCRKKVQAAELLFCSDLANGRSRHSLDLLASISVLTLRPCYCIPVLCYQITLCLQPLLGSNG